MKQSTLLILVAVGLLFVYGCSKYNTIIPARNNVDTKWANVQTQYQRRFDLMDNLVRTVTSEATFEKGTLEGVINARASATKMTVNAADLTPEKLKEFQANQGQIASAMGRFISVAEQYPNLKSNQGFQDLRVAYEGTENRINVARTDYNNSVTVYNNMTETFPTNIVAGFLGFKPKPLFQGDVEAQKAPSNKSTLDDFNKNMSTPNK